MVQLSFANSAGAAVERRHSRQLLVTCETCSCGWAGLWRSFWCKTTVPKCGLTKPRWRWLTVCQRGTVRLVVGQSLHLRDGKLRRWDGRLVNAWVARRRGLRNRGTVFFCQGGDTALLILEDGRSWARGGAARIFRWKSTSSVDGSEAENTQMDEDGVKVSSQKEIKSQSKESDLPWRRAVRRIRTRTRSGTRTSTDVEALDWAGGQQQHRPLRDAIHSLEQRHPNCHFIQTQARAQPRLWLKRRGATGLWGGTWTRQRGGARRLWGDFRGGVCCGSKLRLKPVRVLADELVHVADGNVERASGLAPEVVPPGDVQRQRIGVR